MSINLTESSRDRDGEREGNNCLERGLERTIISPRGRSSPGPRIRPPRVYRGEKGNDLSFLEEGGGRGGVFAFLLRCSSTQFLSPLFPFPSLPPFSQKLYIRAIQFHSEAHIDTNPTIIFTSAPKSGLLKSFHYTFSSCTLEKSDSYLREIGGNSIDRFPSSSFSIVLSFSFSIPLFQAQSIDITFRFQIFFSSLLASFDAQH